MRTGGSGMVGLSHRRKGGEDERDPDARELCH